MRDRGRDASDLAGRRRRVRPRATTRRSPLDDLDAALRGVARRLRPRSHWRSRAAAPRAGDALVRVYAPTRDDGWDARTPSSTSSTTTCRSSSTRSRWRSTATTSASISSCTRSCACARDADGELLGIASDDRRCRHRARYCSSRGLHVEVDRETEPEIARRRSHATSSACSATSAPRPRDWLQDARRARTRSSTSSTRQPPPVDADELAEGKALLHWMADQHFTFLGYRSYDLDPRGRPGRAATGARDRARLAARRAGSAVARASPTSRPRSAPRRASARCSCSRRPTRARRCTARRTSTTSASSATTRTATSIGEHRFLGLYTSSAYTASPIDVPVLRRKVAAVIERAGFLPGESRPQGPRRDPRDLPARRPLPDRRRRALRRSRWASCGCRNAGGCGCSCTASRTAASCRASCSSPATATRRRCACASPTLLIDAFGATSYEWNTRLSAVGARPPALRAARRPAARRRPSTSTQLEAPVAAAARAWVDDLRDALVARARRGGRASTLLRVWGDAFPAAYQDDFDAAEALADLALLRTSSTRRAPLAVRLADGDRPCSTSSSTALGAQPSLSEVLPRLTNMGVDRRRRASVHDHARGLEAALDQVVPAARRRTARGRPAARAPVRRRVPRGASTATPRTTGSTGSCCAPGSSWREVALLRAYSRYLRQARHAVQPDLHRGRRSPRTPTSRAGSSSCSSTRLDPWPRRPASDDASALVDEIDAALDAVDEPRRRPHPARAPAPRARDAAHELVPDRTPTASRAVRRAQARPDADPRPAAAAPDVRDLRVLAARRGRAPARRAASRAAASAGRTGAKTSAPRSSG